MHRKIGWLGLLAVFALMPFLVPVQPAQAAANAFSTALADHAFSRIAVDLSGDNAVYAAGNDSQNNPYVYKSTNQGGTWTLLNSGLPSPFSVFVLAVSASSPQTLYIGGYNFSNNTPLLYRSTNGGSSWSAVGSGLGANVSVQALAIDPANANTVYLGTNAGVYKSSDGTTFAALAGMGTRNVQALILDPTNPAVIYAGTNPSTDGGIWKSSDSGATWTQQNNGLPSGSGVYHLAATPGSSTTFYAAAGNTPTTTSLFKTTNAGANWSAMTLASAVASIAVSPTNANLVLVDGSGGLYRSTDGGSTFVTIGSYANAPVRLDNNAPQTLYVGGQGITSYTGDITAIGATSTGVSGTTNVTGSLWYDTDGNYVRESSEAAAAGAAVTIVCSSCTGTPTVGTTTADASGNYTLSNVSVTSGQLYTVIATATLAGGPTVSSGPNESGESALDLAPGQNPTVNFGLVPLDARYFPQTGYRIDNDVVWNYFQRRGGIPTFGYPVSRTFTFQGFVVQFFQRRIVQLDQSGQARLLNVLDPGLMPYTGFNGSTFPALDSALVATAPPPTDQPAVLAWVQAHAPDVVGSAATNYYSTFLSTVAAQTAFPNGGDASLLPGIELEMWGVPTSGAFVDPHNHNFIYLRWQRGIMMYDGSTGLTQGILLADYLKAIITGQNLPADLAQEAASSPFFDQYDPSQSNWVHNQSLLPATNLTNAFTQE